MAHKLFDPITVILTALVALTVFAFSVQRLPAAPAEGKLMATQAYSKMSTFQH